MDATPGGTSVDQQQQDENMADNMGSDGYEPGEGMAKRPKKKTVALRRKGTGVNKVQGSTLAKHKGNISLNTSISRQTLRSNNRSLARALEVARLELCNLQKENLSLKNEQVNEERRTKKRLGEVHDVAGLLRDKLMGTIGLIETLQAMCTEELAIDQALLGCFDTPQVVEDNVKEIPSTFESSDNSLAERRSAEMAEERAEEAIPTTDMSRDLLEAVNKVVETATNIQFDGPSISSLSPSLDLSTVLEKSNLIDSIPLMFSDDGNNAGDASRRSRSRGHSRSRSGRRSALIYQSSNTDIKGSEEAEEKGPRRSLRARSRSRRYTGTSFGHGEDCAVEEKPAEASADHIDKPDTERNIETSEVTNEKEHNHVALTNGPIHNSRDCKGANQPEKRESSPTNELEKEDSDISTHGSVENECVFKPRKEIPRTPPSRRASQENSLEEEQPSISVPEEDHTVQLPKFISLAVDPPQPKRISPGKRASFGKSGLIPSKQSESGSSSRKKVFEEETQEEKNQSESTVEKKQGIERRGDNDYNLVQKEKETNDKIVEAVNPQKVPELIDDDVTIDMRYFLAHGSNTWEAERKSPSLNGTDHPESPPQVSLDDVPKVQHIVDISSPEPSAEEASSCINNSDNALREENVTHDAVCETSEVEKETKTQIENNKPQKKRRTSKLKESNLEDFEEHGTKTSPEMPKRRTLRRSKTHLRRETYCMLDAIELPVEDEPVVEAEKISPQKERRQRRGTFDIPVEQCASESQTKKNEKSKSGRSRRGTFCVPTSEQMPENSTEENKTSHARRGTFCINVSNAEGELVTEEEVGIMEEVGDMLIDDMDHDIYTDQIPIAFPDSPIELSVPSSERTICGEVDMEMTEAFSYNISLGVNPSTDVNKSNPSEKKTKSVPKKVRKKVSKEEKGQLLKARSKCETKKSEPEKTESNEPSAKDSKIASQRSPNVAKESDDEDFESDDFIKSRHKKKEVFDDDVFKKPEPPFRPPKNMISVRKSSKSSSNSSDSDPNDSEKEKAKSSAYVGRPGKIILTAGRKNIDATKAYLESINKPKSRSKSKVKSMLPRPGKSRSKNAGTKTRLLSLEKEMKMGFGSEKKEDKNKGEVKSVFDLSLNESLTVLPQMSYTDFREQNPAMEEMKAALKNQTKKDADNICSPHGIMLVVRNGKRTKPRVRSKSVTYAKKLAKVHLRTPSKSSDDSSVSYQVMAEAAGRTPPCKKRVELDGEGMDEAPMIVPETPEAKSSAPSNGKRKVAKGKQVEVEKSHIVAEADRDNEDSQEKSELDDVEPQTVSIEETPPPKPKQAKKPSKTKPSKSVVGTAKSKREDKEVAPNPEPSKENFDFEDDDCIPSSQEEPVVSKKKLSKAAELMKKLKKMKEKAATVRPSEDQYVKEDVLTPRRSSSRKRSAVRSSSQASTADVEKPESTDTSDSKRSLANDEITNLDRAPEVKRSRRAASTVSYKEPSLNAKMRRTADGSEKTKSESDAKRKSSKRSSRPVLSTITNTDTAEVT